MTGLRATLWSVTEPEVADLVRALAPYAWPTAAVVIVLVLRDALARAIMRVAERIQRAGLRTHAGQVNVDFEKVTDVARNRVDVLDVISEQLQQLPESTELGPEVPATLPGSAPPKSSRPRRRRLPPDPSEG